MRELDRRRNGVPSRAGFALPAVLALLAAGCSSEGVTDPTRAPVCQGAVSITVGSGTEPIFSWSPVCKVFALLVEERGLDVWLITAAGGIPPGVRYGSLPAGAIEQERAMPLRAGVAYDVIVFRGTSLDDLTLIGSARFTP